MKIKMLTLSASPEGIRKAGEIYDVENDEGKSLVEGGFAELIEDTKSRSKKKRESEE